MRYLIAGMLLLVALGCDAAQFGKDREELMYRINCGAEAEYVDNNNVKWQPDQMLEPGKDWGALGGKTTTREKVLPIREKVSPEVYRTERYGVKAYEFKLPNDTYTVRLHFAEAHESNFEVGARVFDVTVGPEESLKGFDPLKESGGFAKSVVMEFAGLVVTDGKLRIEFTPRVDSVAINGIEILKTGPTERKVTKLTTAPIRKPGKRVKKPDDVKAARILFVGNSYTIRWALPKTIEDMVNSGSSKLRIRAFQSVRGGSNLNWHYNRSKVIEKIKTGNYDYVVLQEYGRPSAEKMLDVASKLDKVIKDSGARTLIYCVWVRVGETPQVQEALTKVQRKVARSLNATFVPVGPAWQAVHKQRPNFNLHSPDKHHPGMHGAYLTACVFYAVLTGESPVGHPFPAVLKQEIEIDKETAAFLQKVAWKTVQKYSALEKKLD